MMLELGDVADVAYDLPAVRAALRERHPLGEIREGDGGEKFATRFEDFLEEYGFRAATEIDFSHPRYYEDPSPLLHAIRGLIEAEAPRAHRQQIEHLEEETEKAIETMEEAADVLAEKGVIEETSDVWFFTFDELIGTLDSRVVPSDVDLGRRRADHERHLQLRAPRVIASDGEMPRGASRPVSDKEGMAGISTASGVAEGIARVIHNPGQAQLKAGEILVAPHTDPGWTPLFLNAAGLVTNVGGKMTHGLIVAREYGIPSVVLSEATDKIKTGQRIRVDGNRGVVELLED